MLKFRRKKYKNKDNIIVKDITVAYFQTHYARARSKSAQRQALKRKREPSEAASKSRARSASRTPRDKSGVRDEAVSNRLLKNVELKDKRQLRYCLGQPNFPTVP